MFAISNKFSTGNAHKSPEMKEKLKLFMDEFMREFSSDLCKDIKPIYKKEDVRCLYVVEKTLDILEKHLK